jgi:bifunctional non-homologous end joining protein LigD
VPISNPEKLFWPKENIRKKDLIEYYLRVSEHILPYLIDRPQSLNRFPDGIGGESFFQKNMKNLGPKWLEKIAIESSGRKIEYLLCQNEATLAYMANLGCIEINPWSSRLGRLDRPDWTVLDLDPEDIDFREVKKVAQAAGELLKKIGATGFAKTSGATGIHIYIPFEPRHGYGQLKSFTHLLAIAINQQLGGVTSLERSPKNRQKKVYLDYLQNSRGQTLVAPYSVRPREGAPVSAPLLWSELETDFGPEDFRIGNIFDRLKKKGDLFRPVLGGDNDLLKILTKLEVIIERRS